MHHSFGDFYEIDHPVRRLIWDRQSSATPIFPDSGQRCMVSVSRQPDGMWVGPPCHDWDNFRYRSRHADTQGLMGRNRC